MDRKCCVDGCENPIRCKSMCKTHYSRMLRNGTTDALPRSGNKNKGPLHNRYAHGKTGSRAYKSWSNMISRCENPKNKSYKDWGARGIKVCDKWRSSFQRFLDDMGEPGHGMTLERLDVDGNYEPRNCVWASRLDQARNRNYCKLDMSSATQMRKMRAEGFTLEALSREYGVSISHAKRVCDGECWADDGKAA